MPLYYDTSPPTPGTKNTITRTATNFGLRDFLLHKNIQNPIRYPQLSTSINGSPRGGEPYLDTMVGTGSIIQHNPLTVDGIPRYQSSILMNQFKDTDPTAPIFLSIDNINKIPYFVFTTAPNGISNYRQVDLTLYGILAKSNEKQYRKGATIKNLYVDATKQIDMADVISLQPQITGQQLTSYLDEYGGLNLGNSTDLRTADIIGSLLSGQGVGFQSGGVVPNFDIRASLAGRVLTATGIINDTKLGVIGGQQLALALANNAAFNTEQEILGSLNTSDNLLSLVKNGNLAGFRPNYKITVPTTQGGRILDSAEKILGFTIPRSYLDESGSIFFSENGGIGNIERANNMILNTGRGQVKSLIANFNASLNGTSPSGYDSPNNSNNFFRSGYAPGFNDNTGQKAINPRGYAFMDNDGKIYNFFGTKGAIPEISFNRENLIERYGFIGFEGNSFSVEDGRAYATKFSWNSGDGNVVNAIPKFDEFIGTNASVTLTQQETKKSLLVKTQKLFNSIGMKTLVSVKGDKNVTTKTQIQTSVSPNGLISKGSGVLAGSMFDINGNITSGTKDPENTFCRAWTPYTRYDMVKKLIRHSGLNKNESGGDIITRGNGWRQQIEGSVLDDNGFVKIAPYKGDDLTRGATAPKKYMFSIENLAWAGTPASGLLPIEQGPGDLLSGKFGRIMWFPPYDLRFSETSSVNLETTNFIGRGEPIYTYNNTERTGTLSFKVIVDHASIMNSFAGNNGPSDDFIRSWMAGCTDLDELWATKLMTADEINQLHNKTTPNNVPQTNIESGPNIDIGFNIYFKNDKIDIDSVYESQLAGTDVSGGENSIPLIYGGSQCTTLTPPQTHFWNYGKSWGLNTNPITFNGKTYNGWIDPLFKTDLKTYLDSPDFKDRVINITIAGAASKQGCSNQNDILASGRADETKTWLESFLLPTTYVKINITTNSLGEIGEEQVNSAQQIEKKYKIARTATIKITSDPIASTIKQGTNDASILGNNVIDNSILKRFYTEADFFEKLTENDAFVFDKIREKIKYFHPAFHSMTPEGFNARLTFLLQCTRQGPTISGIEPQNLAFGTPPVCILRVGDFYNTKIMIDNLTLDFDESTWDLNPEGVGVQPMIANVNLSFKYIGGSSLYGPINKLQNAISFNYFANTQVYDARADYIVASRDNIGNIKQERATGNESMVTEMITQYELKTGINMGKESMVAISKDEANKNIIANNNNQNAQNNNQAKAASIVNGGQIQTGDTKTDLQRITITDYPSQVIANKKILFKIKKINTSDIQPLSSDYNLIVTIINQTTHAGVLTIDTGLTLLQNDLVSNMEKAFTIDASNLSDDIDYTLSIKFLKSSGRTSRNSTAITKNANVQKIR